VLVSVRIANLSLVVALATHWFGDLGGHPKPAINGQLKTGHFE
jgi:hypothetical protein